MKGDKSKRILSRFLCCNWIWVILIVILLTVLGFFRMYGAKYIGDMTDLIVSGALTGLWALIGIGVVAQTAFYVSRWIVAIICQYLTQKLALQVRITLLNHINHIEFLEFENQTVGNLQSLLRNDVTDAANIIYMLFSRILTNVFTVLFSWGYMCLINWKAAILVVLASMLMSAINMYINKKVTRYEYEIRELRGELSNTALNTFEGLDVIKTYKGTGKVLDTYAIKRDKYNKSQQKVMYLRSMREILFIILNNGALFGSVIYFSFQAARGIGSIGETMAFIALLIQVVTPIGIIFRWMTQLTSSTASWKRIYDFLAIKCKEEESILLEEVNNIELRNVNFSYSNSLQIINNFNYKLEVGKIYNLSGASGSGKTTLMKILLGLYPSSTMKVLLNGKSIDTHHLSGMSSYVPSEPLLFQLSIFDNITMGDKQVTREKCMQIAERLGMGDWIKSLPNGLDTIIDENNRNLSGGQAQLIAVLRAFVSKEPVLLLDEPFSALDKEKEKYLEAILQKIKWSKIIVFTSHRTSSLTCVDEQIVL